MLLNITWLVAGYFLLRKPAGHLSVLWYALFRWGAFWLLLGTVFEAYEGGIRKDSATYSYFFLTSGLAFMTLIFFSVWFDALRLCRVLKYLTQCGQNPMVAYVAGTFVIFPLLSLIGLMPFINQLAAISPWYGLLKGLIITGGMMAVTVFTVRMKWFWKT
jgi:predicted acyltransferase